MANVGNKDQNLLVFTLFLDAANLPVLARNLWIG
jgi:hypothetical protein